MNSAFGVSKIYAPAFLAAVLSFCTLANAQSKGAYKSIGEKSQQKQNSRWTLADWMAQKQNNRAMDLWLAKNSYSSPYEFYLDGSLQNYNQFRGDAPEVHQNFNSQNAELGAYAGRAGLRGEYFGDEENRTGWQGGLNFRVYGRAIQDTHISLEWGFRGLTTGDPGSQKYQNQFGSVNLSVYLAKNFGVEGRYLRILPASSDQKTTLSGEESSAQVFIDFWAVRIYGEWKHLYERTKSEASSASESRTGYGGGLRIFF